jgi:tetratricopeptide (TPR) repeat protein
MICPASATFEYGAEFTGLSPNAGEDQKGIVKMQTAAKSNLVLTEFPSLDWLAELQKQASHAEFYQQFAQGLVKGLYTKGVLSKLSERLIALAHQAYTLRRMDVIEQISQALMHLPISHQYRNIGRLYHSYQLRRTGRIAEARHLLEQIIDGVPVWFRGSAIMSLSGLVLATGDHNSALPLYVEAHSAASRNNRQDWFTIAHAQKIIAVLKGIDGNHRGAVADLEDMLPFIRRISSAHPSLYYDYLNSLAVEFGEVGRIEEARNICKIVLASPLASAYPECRETYNELELRGYNTPRSFVPVTQRALNKENVLPLPVPESNASPDSAPNQSGKPARVFDLTAWKEKMPKEPNGSEKEPQLTDEDLTERERVYKIINLITEPGLSAEKQIEILKFVEKVVARPDTISTEDADKD